MAELYWNGIDLGEIVEVGYTTSKTMYYPGRHYGGTGDSRLNKSVINNPAETPPLPEGQSYYAALGGYDAERWQKRVHLCLASPGQKYAAGSYVQSIANPLGENPSDITSVHPTDPLSFDCLQNQGSWNQVGTWRTKTEMVELYNLHRLMRGQHTSQNTANNPHTGLSVENNLFPTPTSALWNYVWNHWSSIFNPGSWHGSIAGHWGFVPPMIPYIKTKITPQQAFGPLDTPVWKFGNHSTGDFDESWHVDLNKFQPCYMYYQGVTNVHAMLNDQGSTTEIPDDAQLLPEYYSGLNAALSYWADEEVDDFGYIAPNQMGPFYTNTSQGDGLLPVVPMYPFLAPPSTQPSDYFHQHPPQQNLPVDTFNEYVTEGTPLGNLFANEIAGNVDTGLEGDTEPGTYTAVFNQGTGDTNIRLPHATFALGAMKEAPRIQSGLNVLPRNFNPMQDNILSQQGNILAENGWLPGDSVDAVLDYVKAQIGYDAVTNEPMPQQMLLSQCFARITAGRHALLGMQPLWYSFDEFFIQDYDIAGVFTYDTDTGLPKHPSLTHGGTIDEEIEANLSMYLEILGNPIEYNMSVAQWAKLYVMYRRFQAIVRPEGEYGEQWPHGVPFLNSDLSATNINSLYPEWFFSVEQEGDSGGSNGLAGTFANTPWNRVETKGAFAPLGPPAPPGYVPKAGVNLGAYLGISGPLISQIDVSSTTTNPGGYPFVFQNGINFNADNADTLTGYVSVEDYVFPTGTPLGNSIDLSALLNSYQSQTNIDVENQANIAYRLLDTELWKYFYKMRQALQKFVDNTSGFSNAYIFTPSEIPAQMINTSLVITNREKELINYAVKLDIGMSDMNLSFMDFFQQTTNNFNPFLDNPGSFGGMPSIIEYGMLDDIRNKLIQIPIAQGGIANWEIVNFLYWVLSNGSVVFPPGGTGGGLPSPPELPDNFSFYDDNTELGTFVDAPWASGRLLSPGVNEFTYTGPDFVGGDQGMWQACDYLNSHFPNGNVLSVTRLGLTSQNNPADYQTALVYSQQPFLTPEGNIETNPGWYPSRYLSGDSYSTQDFNVLENQPGVQSIIQVIVSDTQPEFYSPAFGPAGDPETDYTNAFFSSNVTVAQMIQQLHLAGYDGPTLDAYPTAADSGGTESGDGVINSLDGLMLFNQLGDYRPYQFIKWCELNGLENLIYTYFPIGEAWNNGENSYPGANFDIPGLPPLFYISPNAIRSVKPHNKIVAEFTPLLNGPFKGRALLGGNAMSHSIAKQNQNLNLLYDNHESPRIISPESDNNYGIANTFDYNLTSANYRNGEQYGNNRNYIVGDEIFTQSLANSNDAYGYNIMSGDPDKPGAQKLFTIHFGHLKGSGSLAQSNSQSPSYAVYKQFAATLRNQEVSGSFYSKSGSLAYPGFENQDLPPSQIGQHYFNPDSNGYFISADKNIVGDGLHDRFILKLEGKKANGHGAVLHLTSDYEHPIYEQGTGLKRLTIVSGSWNSAYVGSIGGINNFVGGGNSLYATAAERRYGYYYPEVGIWYLSDAVGNENVGGFAGEVGSNVPVAFNDSTQRNNGLSLHGKAKSDKDYKNALLLANCMKNRGSKITMQVERKTEELHQAIMVKVPSDALNFSLNPSKLKGYNAEGEFNDFGGSMSEQVNSSPNQPDDFSPTTYPNKIEFYNSTGYLVAVANFSKAIRKDFNKELVIKAIIPLG